MPDTIRVLILEDNDSDVQLLLFELQQAGIQPEWRCVKNEHEYLNALNAEFDVILADYSLPQFNAARALQLLQERQLDIPFIIVSGNIGEETAIAAMKQGATDYLLKDRLGRLGAAVHHALQETEMKRRQRRMEEALRVSQEFARNVLESSLDMIVAVNGSRRIIEFNRAAQATFGYTLDEIIGQPADVLYADPSEGARINEIVVSNGHCVREVLNKMKSGQLFSTVVSASAIRNARGEMIGVMAVGRNITDRKRDEARLAAFAALGRSLGSARHAKEAAITIVQAADELIGWDACTLDLRSPDGEHLDVVLNIDTIDGQRTDFLPAFDHTKPSALQEKAMREGAQLILRDAAAFSDGLRPFGDHQRPSASLMFVPIRHDADVIGVLSVQSYTDRAYAQADLHTLQALADHCAGTLERIRTLNALRETEQRFTQLAQHIREVFWLSDIGMKRIVYLSPAFEEIWGRPATEIIANPAAFLDFVLPQDRDIVRAFFARQQTERCEAEYRIIRPDGSIRWIRDRAFPVRNDQGQIYRTAGVAEEITERKRLESQVFHAQRMESIGTLASGIAHDLNNVLGPILMASQILRMKSLDAECQNLITTIASSAQRGADIVKQVLTFARKIEGERIAIQLRHLVNEMVKIARQTFPKNIQVSLRTAEHPAPVLGDATQLHQVLLNLCVNARDAMPNGGLLTLSCETVQIDESFAAMVSDARPGLYTLLSVEDTGAGIPPAILDKIFDPFFTTKEQGKGTGLGLSTVLGIVRGHGGFVQVQSVPGRGTAFKVFLPSTSSEPLPIPSENDTAQLPSGNGELILVVDDEANIRDVTRNILTTYNYYVLVANDGAEALVLFAQNSDRIKLVLTDIIMPVMDGVALVRAIRRMNPQVRIIASSGLGQDKIAELHALQVATFLDKPYPAEKLLHTIASELAR